MRVYIDLDTRAIVVSPTLLQRVGTLFFTRRDILPLEVQFVRAGVVQELASGATGKCGIGQTFGGDLLALDSGWDKTGTTTSTVYTFQLSLNTTEIDELFDLEEGEPDEILGKLEIEWSVGGTVTTTLPAAAVIYNDVIRDDAAIPTEVAAASFLLQSPDDSVWSVSIDDNGALTATKQA